MNLNQPGYPVSLAGSRRSTPKMLKCINLLVAILACSGCAPPATSTPSPATASPLAVNTSTPVPEPTETLAPAATATTGPPATEPPPALPGLVPEGASTRIGKGWISALAAGPDFLAVGSSIGICLYSLPEIEEMWCAATSRWVVSLAISPDGERLAAGLEEGDLVLWDLIDRTEIGRRRISANGGPAALAFSPDGSHLAAILPGTMALWDGLTLAEFEELSVFPAYAGEVAFSPDGRFLAWIDYGTNNQSLRIHDLIGGVTIETIELPLFSHSLAWKPDSRTVIAALAGGISCYENCDPEMELTTDGGLFFYDLAEGEARQVFFEIPDASMLSMALNPDGVSLAVWLGEYEPQLFLVDLRDPQPQPQPIQAEPNDYLRQMTWDPGGRLLYFLNADGGLGVWEPGTEASQDLTLPGYGNQAWTLTQALSPDGGTLAVYHYHTRQRLELYSVLNGELLAETVPSEPVDIFGLRWSPDGTRLALLGYQSVQVYELATGEFTPLLGLEQTRQLSSYYLRWTPDGTLVAVGIGIYDETDSLEMYTIRVLDSFTGELLLEIDDAGAQFEITPDSLSLLVHRWESGFSYETLSLIELATGEVRSTIALDHGLYGFAIVPGGSSLIALQDQELVSFSMPAGDLIWSNTRTEDGMETRPYGPLAVSPDGRWIASAGRDVALWDPIKGELVKVFSGHTDFVVDMVFTPDGERLVTASEDGTVIVWVLP